MILTQKGKESKVNLLTNVINDLLVSSTIVFVLCSTFTYLWGVFDSSLLQNHFAIKGKRSPFKGVRNS